MRTLFVGALAVTLVGCGCFVSSQAGAKACTSASGCVVNADSATPRTSSEMASNPIKTKAKITAAAK
jgi:hypothetical protein